MDIRRDPDSGRQAVLWLATAFVILIGAAACGFIILAAVDQPSQPLLVLGSIFGGIVVVLIMTAFRREGGGGSSRWMLSWLIRERAHPKHVLRIGRKRPKADTEFGTNAPPTLDSVRETAELNVRWAPKGPAPDRTRPK